MTEGMNFPTAREHVLRVGETQIGVIPELSLVSHFQVGGWAVLYRPMETGNVRRWGLPLMLPNFSRLENGIFKEKGTTLPMHGFGRVLPWSVVGEDQSSMTIQLESSEYTRAQYPYEFTFTVMVTVGEGTLTYRLTMENRGTEVMPIAPGFHPYFAVTQEDKAKIEADGPLGFEVGAFDWDTSPPNNPYPFPHHVTVLFPNTGILTISELEVEGRYGLATMQVWSEPASAPDHDFVCFEPVVTAEDGLNRPADRLNIEPGKSRQIVLQLAAKPF